MSVSQLGVVSNNGNKCRRGLPYLFSVFPFSLRQINTLRHRKILITDQEDDKPEEKDGKVDPVKTEERALIKGNAN